METFVFPGQGAQQKGMGADLFRAHKRLVDRAGAILGYDVKELCLDNPEDRLNQTQYTQPALYVVQALSYLQTIKQQNNVPDYLAGHSLGEYAALFAAGAVDFETGLWLVKNRAELMARTNSGAMASVLGLAEDYIRQTLAEHDLAGLDLVVFNTEKHIVIAGPQDELSRAGSIFKSIKTSNFIPLKVSGAFHSRYMAPAAMEFKEYLDKVEFFDFCRPVISNVTAKPHHKATLKQLLVEQIFNPVRWRETIFYLLEQGATGFKEIGPGSVLEKINQQILNESINPIHRNVNIAKNHFGNQNTERKQKQKSHDGFYSSIANGDEKESKKSEIITSGEKEILFQRCHQERKGKSETAIIGIACRFPGAENYGRFWQNLVNRANSIREIGPDRWDIGKYYSPDITDPNKSVSKWSGLIENIDRFDNGFFNISPREAKNMDPQQRLLLEETWHCIEDAGIPLKTLRDKKTSVYVGAMASDYRQQASGPGILTDSYAAQGNYDAILANRVSYAFGFSGTSISIDATCASSLVALNGAKRNLLSGESEYAIAAGVNLIVHPWKYISFSKAGMLSPEGQCKTFDADANGFVSGEGIAVLLLQRLDDAIKSGNHIYGVIKGLAVNHGGQGKSLTAPKVSAQRDVILSAYKEADISPETVTYVEAHGTGTSLGDPIEIEALTQAFHSLTTECNFCKIGSVKSNIGHLEAAAGLAGVIKVLLMMQHRVIPASLNIKKLNPMIHLENSPFSIATDLSKWVNRNKTMPLRAGISSFGMGGVNTHLILEEYIQQPMDRCVENSQFFTISAKTPESLKKIVENWRAFVKTDAFAPFRLKDICQTLLTGRASFAYRCGFPVENKQALQESLSKIDPSSYVAASKKAFCLRIGHHRLDRYVHLQPMLRRDKAFKKHMAQLHAILTCLTQTCKSFDELDYFRKLETGLKKQAWSNDEKAVYTFMIGYAAATTLIELGAVPELITGDKNGVWTALALSGMISPFDVISVFTTLKKPEDIVLSRPTIPFFDPISRKTFLPNVFTREYLVFLLTQLRIQDELFEYYIEKARMLLSSQYTFKKYIQEWNSVLSHLGKDIEQMISPQVSIAQSGHRSEKEKILIVAIIVSSLRRLRLKWDLRQHKPRVDSIFSELLDLVTDEVITKEMLVEFLLSDAPDIHAIAESLTLRRHRMSRHKPYQYIKTQNKVLGEIEDFPGWLEKVVIKDTLPPLWENLINMEVGDIKINTRPDRAVFVNLHELLDKTPRDFLLRLWLKGVDIKWDLIYPENSFRKTPLPGYAFNGKSFWISRDENGRTDIVTSKNNKKFATATSCGTNGIIDRPIGEITMEAGHGTILDKIQPNPGEKKPVRHDGRLPKDKALSFLRTQWVKTEMTPGLKIPSSLPENWGPVLLFDTNGTFKEDFKKLIKKQNWSPQIISVKQGTGFKSHSDELFEIDPTCREDYNTLVLSLKNRNLLPRHIIHLWALGSLAPHVLSLDRQLDNTFYSLFHLSQVLCKQRIHNEMVLLFVYASSQDESHPWCAAAAGFFKTIRLEKPNFFYKSVELFCHNETPLMVMPDELPRRLFHEIGLHDLSSTVIRYSGNQRFVEQLMKIPVASDVQNSLHDMPLPLKENGIYLIAGGCGGLGLIFADYLIKKVKANLILTGRSCLNARINQMVDKLEGHGSKVLYKQCDISSRDDVRDLVRQVKHEFGRIDGVIHSAGVIRDAFLPNQTIEDLRAELAPKIKGTVNLDEALENDRLDFFILFSSIVAIYGNLGQCGYAYANGFMDVYAKKREYLRSINKRHGRTISINWPLWRRGGMQMTPDDENRLTKLGFMPLPTDMGIKAFETILRLNLSQCIIAYSASDLSQADMVIRPVEKNGSEFKTKETINMKPLYETTVLFLKRLIGELSELKLDEIDSHTAFGDYGVDSFMIHQFNGRMEQHFQSLSPTLLFEYQSIHELAEFLIDYHKNELEDLFGKEMQKKQQHVEQERERPDAAEPNKIPASLESFNDSTHAIQVRKELLHTQPHQSIAIIGLFGRYPQAGDPEAFWKALKTGKDCITQIPPSRWPVATYYDPDPEKAAEGKMYCKWGGFLEDVDKFDPLFFNISPREAETMDPQERLFLETAWHTLEDAGYTGQRIRDGIRAGNRSDVGVFVGVTTNTYMLLAQQGAAGEEKTMPISLPWSVANRVSHFLNFHGPSLSVDTACSSSLTAVHMACESLRHGECSLALAGGVNLYLHPSKYVYLCRMKMLSRTGKCSSFGEAADGFVPGEGVGAVLLKPLADAVRDRDNIYAVIKGSAVNHGGRMHGYTVPNPNAQAALISQALGDTNARTISYVEAHGTGTSLGDPVEVTGLRKACEKGSTDKQYCAIGSVKSNIGHLEAAAGIAGLTKVLLQIKHKQLVPSLNAEELNAGIRFEDSPFYLQRKLTDWRRPVIQTDAGEQTFPRRAGVSSFGAGGVNAHIVIEEYIRDEQVHVVSCDSCMPHLVVLSAKAQEQLKAYAAKLAVFLENAARQQSSTPSLADMAFTLQVGREAMGERLCFTATSTDEVIHKLKGYPDNSHHLHDAGIMTGKNSTWSFQLLQKFKHKEFSHDFINLLVKHRDLEFIGMLWVSGMDMPWEKLYDDMPVQRISLPTYPFERKRYWVPVSSITQPSRPLPEKIAPIHDRSGSIDNALRQMVSDLLKLPEAQIPVDRDLREYGFDSIAGIRLINRIAELYDVELSITDLFENRTITAIAGCIEKWKNNRTSGKMAFAPAPLSSPEWSGHDVDHLKEAEIDALLHRLLEKETYGNHQWNRKTA